MRQREIELHIDELVVSDSPGLNRDRFVASLEGRLIDLLATGSTRWNGGHRDFAQATLETTSGRADQLGASVGDAIGGALKHE